jgi:RimJ/RimL family protein N-acetyltransferase
MSSDDEILTRRLALRLMPEEFLKLSLEDDPHKARLAAGFEVHPEWFDAKSGMEYPLQQLRSDPEYAPWSSRAVCLRSTNTMVGNIRFHTRPNAEYLRPYVGDGVELGYGVFSDYRRRGIAQEAIRGLIGWAAQQHGVRRFVVSISPSNVPSTALAHKLGFARVSEWQDEVDGLEYVYLLEGERLALFLGDGLRCP